MRCIGNRFSGHRPGTAPCVNLSRISYRFFTPNHVTKSGLMFRSALVFRLNWAILILVSVKHARPILKCFFILVLVLSHLPRWLYHGSTDSPLASVQAVHGGRCEEGSENLPITEVFSQDRASVWTAADKSQLWTQYEGLFCQSLRYTRILCDMSWWC